MSQPIGLPEKQAALIEPTGPPLGDTMALYSQPAYQDKLRQIHFPFPENTDLGIQTSYPYKIDIFSQTDLDHFEFFE